MELIPTILDQLHSEVIVKTALSAAKSERWLEIPFHKLLVLAATGNSWFVGLPDISNNVGSVKCFLSALLHSLRGVIFLVLL